MSIRALHMLVSMSWSLERTGERQGVYKHRWAIARSDTREMEQTTATGGHSGQEGVDQGMMGANTEA